MISPPVIKLLEIMISSLMGVSFRIDHFSAISGGCINQAYVLHSQNQSYFIKINDALKYPGMFEKEVLGLKTLLNTGTIALPEPCGFMESANISFILMEYIYSSRPQSDFWESFGRSLAKLHRYSSDSFGLDHDNYIGSLHQCNSQHDNWISFYIEERIQPLIKTAIDLDKMDHDTDRRFSMLFNKFDFLMPLEPPSLLHGDLWSGNYMVTSAGQPCLIDPAIYYGHREMDIAMTKLFGGFDSDFYNAYTESFPLAAGWVDRVDLFNLYPLLVHLNLFGGGYLQDLKNILKKYS